MRLQKAIEIASLLAMAEHHFCLSDSDRHGEERSNRCNSNILKNTLTI